MLFAKARLNDMVQQGYITSQRHSELPLTIYCYSRRAVTEQYWNSLTTAARGLILDDEGQVVANPMPKFFNHYEYPDGYLESIPIPFKCYEKLDGSLGITYRYGNDLRIATKSRFDSPQALVATNMLHTQYGHALHSLRGDRTYMFEIIYPGDAKVVNYGSMEALKLIAVRDTATGIEIPIEETDAYSLFPVPMQIPVRLYEVALALPYADDEGYVLTYEHGLRVKIKHDRYRELFKLMKYNMPKQMLKLLREGMDADQIIASVPMGRTTEAVEVYGEYMKQFATIKNSLHHWFVNNIPITADRKKQSEAIMQFDKCYRASLFAMLDGELQDTYIWKLVQEIKYD